MRNKEEIGNLYKLLQKAVEERFGTKPCSPKGFVLLSNSIKERTHYYISPTTLKRFWGYLNENVTPFRYTLNILSVYAGYSDWNDFAKRLDENNHSNILVKCNKKPICIIEHQSKNFYSIVRSFVPYLYIGYILEVDVHSLAECSEEENTKKAFND